MNNVRHSNLIKKENHLSGLGIYLYQDGLLTLETILSAMECASQKKLCLVNYLVKQQILSSKDILACCLRHFDLPVFDLEKYDSAWIQTSTINTELILKYHIIPLNIEDNMLLIGVSDPSDQASISTLSFQTGQRIRPMLVDETLLEQIINSHCRQHILYSQLETTLFKMAYVEEQATQQHTDDQDDEPVILFVNQLLDNAIKKNISDVHIEPFSQHCRIRFRRDGLLYEAASIPTHLALRVTTRLKIMANLNISEKRIPQDGRIQLKQELKTDMRINTCPTLFGEKIVLRILNASHIKLDIDLLGLTDHQQKIFHAKLLQPQGLIIVTGPTGSGKTITLYSALQSLNQIEKNISTIEDPVEIELPGINQVTINSRIGLEFSSILRSILRQDPDVLMIGEIRDKETATIAMQAAQTGHLVLSTLHTNGAIEAINRLQCMGMETFNFVSAVSLIIAQRLVRKLCPHCKQPSTSSIGYEAIGCDACHYGYQGRTGIFEIIPLTPQLSESILSRSSVPTAIALEKHGWKSLWNMGLSKVQDGIISYAELTRVLGSEC